MFSLKQVIIFLFQKYIINNHALIAYIHLRIKFSQQCKYYIECINFTCLYMHELIT